MKAETASAIQRLKQSFDFQLLEKHLQEELDQQVKHLMSLQDNVLMYRAQGASLLLQKFFDDVKHSAEIARKK